VNFGYITNQKRDLMHVSFDKPRERWQRVKQNVKLNTDYVSLNTESCVDLNSLVKRVYQEHFCLLSDEWKDCYVLVRLVVLKLSQVTKLQQSLLIDR